MKKIVLSLFALGMLSITSCRKCFECQVNAVSSNGIEYCEGDYTAEQMDALRDNCEALNGGEWVEK